jgi:hypothetical protein
VNTLILCDQRRAQINTAAAAHLVEQPPHTLCCIDDLLD